MESLFGSYRKTVAKDQSESDICLAILETHLGVNGRGESTNKDTVWKILDRHFVVKDSDVNAKFGLTTPDRKRRQMEATKNVLLQLQLDKDELAAQQEPHRELQQEFHGDVLISFLNDDPSSHWVYVRKKIPNLVVSGGAAARRFQAKVTDVENAAKIVHGSFSFQRAENILLDDNLPPLKDLFYLVNTVTTPSSRHSPMTSQ